MAHERKGNPMNIYYQAASVLAFLKIVMSRAGGMHCSWISSMISVLSKANRRCCSFCHSVLQHLALFFFEAQ